MNTHSDKNQEKKSKAVSNAIPPKQSSGKSTFQFIDNRPRAIAQRKLQELVNNSSQVKQAAQLQAMADNYNEKNSLLFVNNRPEAVAQRKLQKIETNNSVKKNKSNLMQRFGSVDNRNQNEVVQRLIVTSKDTEKDFVILASIGAYLKHKGDQDVQFFGEAAYNSINPNSEALFIIDHGEGGLIANKTPDQMKNELETKGRNIPTNIERINLAACESGKSTTPQKQDSYAHKLRKSLGSNYPSLHVLGVPGEATITNLDNAREAVVSNIVKAFKIDRKLRAQLDKDLGTTAQDYVESLDGNIKAKAVQAADNKHIQNFFRKFHSEDIFDRNAEITRARE